jgi:antitoxin (DNA-binding transcriptional repressor) of toxin-antitoxin stability system
MEYKKINLRKFRHNLTQLKDSLDAGQAYEVIDRGKSLAYFIPSSFEIETKKKTPHKDINKILEDAIGCVKMTEEEKKSFDPDAIYRKALEDKYLK